MPALQTSIHYLAAAAMTLASPSTGPSLSTVEQSSPGHVTWYRTYPLSNRREIIADLQTRLSPIGIAWNPGRDHVLVTLVRNDLPEILRRGADRATQTAGSGAAHDEETKDQFAIWEIDAATGKASKLPLPTLESAVTVDYDDAGSEIAFTQESLDPPMAGPMRLRAFRFDGRKWQIVETKVVPDFVGDWITSGLALTRHMNVSGRGPGPGLDSTAVTDATELAGLAPFMPWAWGHQSWRAHWHTFYNGRLAAPVFHESRLFPPEYMAPLVVRRGSTWELPEGMSIPPETDVVPTIQLALKEHYLLAIGDFAGPATALLYDIASGHLVYRSETANLGQFWPDPLPTTSVPTASAGPKP